MDNEELVETIALLSSQKPDAIKTETELDELDLLSREAKYETM